jgi:hypothetical protein
MNGLFGRETPRVLVAEPGLSGGDNHWNSSIWQACICQLLSRQVACYIPRHGFGAYIRFSYEASREEDDA